MTSQEHRSVPTPVVGALGLLALGLVLLGVGGFVQFDDTAGFGSDQWVRPLGFIAALVAVAGVGVACLSAQARRWLGGALGVLDLFVIWQSVTNDGFRFVWNHDEGELFLLQVLLGLTALVLIATGLQPFKRPAGAGGRWLVRVAAYACGTAIAAYLAFNAGVWHYETQVCTNEDCDLGGLEGLFWSIIAIGVCVAVAVVIEVVLLVKRRQRRTEGQPV
ncbi:hypothetical protein [Kribbella sp. CA-294648]|uniref:hypothetical protein n=1 Tax=Kribbella sp. CA-294648 TaxID=3239948 RepID=UPI003D9051F7